MKFAANTPSCQNLAIGKVTMAVTQRLVLDVHGIGVMPSWVEPDEALYWCDAPSTFEAILDAIPAASAAAGIPIELTFDDGNESDARIATPALVKRNLRAAFFVCAGRIGQAGYLDRSAMLEMIDAGMAIGSHGWSHVDWRRVDAPTLQKEVHEARRKIEDVVGQIVDSVAIPFGSYDRRVMSELGAFKTIYTSDGGLAETTGRIVPRESYRKDWASTAVADMATKRESALGSVRRTLKSAIKRMR
jgi:peptidoglycan/xylan/chitin deacetylase (PgdA/CDA1 family)